MAVCKTILSFLSLIFLMTQGPTVCAQDYLAFANRRYIRRLELDSFSLRTLYTGSFSSNFIAFDYDYRLGFQYWTDVQSGSTGSIFKSNLDGGGVTTVINESLAVPDGLAIDWLTNKLYWSEATPETISVLDLERGHRLTLFTLPQSSIPRGIALDPMNGYMFWTDWGSPGKVERAYMDGTGRITLANTSLVWPNDITIDYGSQTLYWVDASLDKIESAGYDGSNRRILVSSVTGLLHPFSITWYNNTLYWTDWQRDGVFSKSLQSNTVRTLTSSLGTDPMGIEAISPSRQQLVSTPCDTNNGNCEQLCLLSANRTATCACVEGYVLSSNGRTCVTPDFLIFANRQYIRRLDLVSFSLQTLYASVFRNFIAFDFDYRRNLMYWTDVSGSTSSIYRSNLQGGEVTTIISRTLDVPDGLAIDWLTNKLYWSEATPETISVLDLERGHRLTLFTLPQSSIPRGIALDPVNGYMFWTDWGSPGKVERAYMDGTGRMTLANTSLVWPNDITIDYESQTLYWVDASLDKIESAFYDGSNRQVIVSSGVPHPFSVTFYNRTLYWTDWVANAIYSKSFVSNITSVVYGGLSSDPMGIEAVVIDRQALVSTPCDVANGNCEQLCLLSANRAARCACVAGYTLTSNGQNCTQAQEYLVFANRQYIQRLELGSFTLRTLYTDSRRNFIAFDYDFRRGFQYWTDVSSGSIYRSTLDGGSVTRPISGSLQVPDGLAIDWLTNKLYWSEATPETISVLDLERGHRLTLFTLPQSSIPRGIALDPVNGYMFWTDWGSPGKVERAYMDGTERMVIADTSLIWPNDITIDYESQTLYWIDANLDKMESAGYDGSNRRTLVSSGLSHPFSITFFDNTLYWTDWTADAVYMKSTGSSLISIAYSGLSTEPMGIEVVSSSRQRLVTTPCDVANGNCEQLCLLSANRTATCACVDGYTLASDGVNCTRVSGCSHGDVRLVGGSTPMAGRVEVCNNGDWGTVCDDGWSVTDGNVVCRQLGFGFATSAPCCASFGQGIGSIVLDGVSCSGGEATLFDCPHRGLGSHNCGHFEDAGVVCTGFTTFTPPPPTTPPTPPTTPPPPGSCRRAGFTDCCRTGNCEGSPPGCFCDSSCVLLQNCCEDFSEICNTYTCSSLTISNGAITYNPNMTSPFDIGTVATYSCNAGFHLSGSFTRTCVTSGTLGVWTGTAPLCLAIECSSLAAPSNGLVTYSSDSTSPFDYQTVATYICNAGYGLIGGSRTRQCVSSSSGDRGWSGTAPTCEIITCSTVSSISNGRVVYSTGSTLTSGTTVTYSCSEGYALSGGDAVRTCQGNGFNPFGVWSGVAPSCRAITCTSLSQINNGLVTYSPDSTSPFSFGTTATYSCNEGFFLQGDRVRTCSGDGSGLNGVWSGSAPVCAVVTCTTVPSISNGGVVYSGVLTSGTTATYSCNEGYALSGGDAIRTCERSGFNPVGVWSGVAPSCRAITCTSLSQINNGLVTYSPDTTSPFSFGTTATYSCNEGFFLQGGRTRTCVGDGSGLNGGWSGSAPVCSAVMCPVLTAPTNGVITYSGGSSALLGTATYNCYTGFRLSGGNTVRTCVGAAGSSGKWTGTAPTCQAVFCSKLPAPENGVITFSDNTSSLLRLSDTATYSCNIGFGLSGGSTVRTCVGAAGNSGIWTGTAPTCQALTVDSGAAASPVTVGAGVGFGGVVIVVLALVLLAIIVVIILKRKRGNRDTSSNNTNVAFDNPSYAEVGKE